MDNSSDAALVAVKQEITELSPDPATTTSSVYSEPREGPLSGVYTQDDKGYNSPQQFHSPVFAREGVNGTTPRAVERRLFLDDEECVTSRNDADESHSHSAFPDEVGTGAVEDATSAKCSVSCSSIVFHGKPVADSRTRKRDSETPDGGLVKKFRIEGSTESRRLEPRAKTMTLLEVIDAESGNSLPYEASSNCGTSRILTEIDPNKKDHDASHVRR